MDTYHFLINQLNKLLSTENCLLEQESQELKTMPKGTLVVRQRKDRYFYGHLLNAKEKGITKETELVYKLARKQHLLRSIKCHENNIYRLKQCISKVSNTGSSIKTPNSITHLQQAHLSAKEYDWMTTGHSKNPFKPENLIYKTHSGIMVRSKSERIIADRLFYHGIAFKYEPAFDILGHEIYPDFVILRADGRIIIWEHNGLMNDPEYAQRAIEKIARYNEAGYYQHKNLICTQEQDILDDESIDDIIFRFIMT